MKLQKPLLVLAAVILIGGAAFWAYQHFFAASSGNFRYDEVVKARIGAVGGVLENADKSIVVTVPSLNPERELTLSFKKSDYPVNDGVRSPITIRISPDVDLMSSTIPMKIRVKYTYIADHDLPIPYLIGQDDKMDLVDLGELDQQNHYFTIFTFHGGDYSWVYAKEGV